MNYASKSKIISFDGIKIVIIVNETAKAKWLSFQKTTTQGLST